MMTLTQSHAVLSQTEERNARRKELRELIKDRLKSVTFQPDGNIVLDAAAYILKNLDRVTCLESLANHLEFLQSLPSAGATRADVLTFIDLTTNTKYTTAISPAFLYKAHLMVDGFAGAFDVFEGVLGLSAHEHLEHLMCGDNGEVVSLALLKATFRIASENYASNLVTSSRFRVTEMDRSYGYHIRNQHLARMIAENPERADDIADAVIARGLFPGVDALWEIINWDSPVLSDGVI